MKVSEAKIIEIKKIVDRRGNNLYPQEWKIKSSHIPEGDNHILKCKSIS